MSAPITIPLHRIKTILWEDIKTAIDSNAIPSVEKYVAGGEDENPTRIQVSVTKGDYFEPDRVIVDVQISNYQCRINGVNGAISVMFSMPYVEIEECAISHGVVHIDHVSDEFWGDRVTDIQIKSFIVQDWNG